MSSQAPDEGRSGQGDVKQPGTGDLPGVGGSAISRLSVPARVGLFTVTALTALAVAVFWLGNFQLFSRAYRFRVWFPDVAGLGTGARVQLMGVRIGQVLSLAPAAERVIVNVEIDDSRIQIQRDATFMISQNGLLGEKVIDVQPSKKVPLPHPGQYIEPDALIPGHPAPSLTAIVGDVQYAVRKLRSYVDDPKNQKRFQLAISRVMNATKSIQDAMGNVAQITARTNRIVARVEQVSNSAAPEVSGLVRNARLLTGNMNSMVADVRRLVSNPENRNRMNAIIQNMSAVTGRLNGVLEDLQKVTGDAGIRQDLKAVLRDARATMQNASAITKSIKESPASIFSFNAAGELVSSLGNDPNAPYVQANLLGQINVGENNYFRLGLQDAGGRNMLELQYGLRLLPSVDVRAGIIRGKLGLGGTLHISESTDFIMDVFDLRTVNARATLNQHLFGNWGLSAFYQRNFPHGINEFGLGVRWRLMSRE